MSHPDREPHTTPLYELARKELENQQAALAAEMAGLEVTKTALNENPDKILLTIQIESAWVSEGETSPKLDFVGVSLEDALAKSIEYFKQVNNRQDVQGRFSVILKLPGGTEVEVPETIWGEIVADRTEDPSETLALKTVSKT